MRDTRLTVTAAVAVAAGAVTLSPVFQDASYFWPTAATVTVVAVCGQLARRFGVPRPLVVLATLAGLAAVLTFLYARDVALFGFVPGPGAVEVLRATAEVGVEDINRFAAPVRPYDGIVAITVAGIGAVAVLVDTLAVTLHRAALAGLPLLALYCVPSAVVPEGAGWLPFVIGAMGYLALLLVDNAERVRAWGRPLGRSRTDRPAERGYLGEIDTTSLMRVGRRVGAVALGAAVAVPALLPNLNEGVFGAGGPGFGSGDGSRTVNVVNPIVDLRRDLVRPNNRTVIRYETDDPSPGYLRVATLDTFTGESWVPAKLEATSEQDVSRGLPPPPGLSKGVPSKTRQSTIQVGDLQDPRLPLPYPTVEVDAEGQWRYDQPTRNVFSFRNDTRGLRYEVVSLDLDYQPTLLRAADTVTARSAASAGDVRLPNEIPPLLRSTTVDVTADARTDYDIALAIQRWLRTEFRYSLATQQGNNASALVEFLRDRSGYCEQFAATMAIMARLSGIPARVNVGFTQGHQLEDGTWQVSLHDAHAWPELHFPGVGWVPFEPTPRSDGSTPEPDYADEGDVAAIGQDDGRTTPGDANSQGSDPRSANEQRTREQLELARRRLEGSGALGGPGAAGAGEDSGGVPVVAVAVTAGVVVLLAIPAGTRALVRRRRWRRLDDDTDGIRVAWAELEDSGWDHGLARRPQETPRVFASRLCAEGRLTGEAADAATRLARSWERARFAPTPSGVQDLRRDVNAVRTGLSDASRPRTRWRARVLPASTRSLVTVVSERVADALDWVDASATRARSALARLVGRGRRTTG